MKKDKSVEQTAEQTTATTTTTTATKKQPKAVDPAVAEAKAKLEAARATAAAAEAKAKADRKAAREAAAAARAAAKTEPRPTCTGTKKDGSACTAKAKVGSERCVDHQPAWDRLTSEEHQAFGRWLRQARGPEIVAEIGWYRAKQIAKETAAERPVLGTTAAAAV